MKKLLFHLLLCISPFCMAQEDCSNGIDDDNDQLIDLNDDDCVCEAIITTSPTSLIPNPSFEDNSCLPQGFSSLDCADDWIQASDATSDYFHVDGFMPGDFGAISTVPLPIPEGNAFVGVINEYSFFTNYKEYIGACLTSDLPANTSTTIQFYVGFSNMGFPMYTSAPQIEICIFGSTNCSNLPFEGYDCPSDYSPEWIELACVTVAGSNEWVQTSLTYTSTEDISAIILGPNCPPLNSSSDVFNYYYLDNLIVNQSVFFEDTSNINSQINCDGTLNLGLNISSNFTYQWYNEGVAMVGETNAELSIANPTTGTYQVLLYNNIEYREML